MGRIDGLTRLVAREWRDERSRIFLAVSAGWFLSIGIRMTYPVLLPLMRSSFGLSLTQVGLLLTVLWLAYAVGQVPGGLLADRFGEGLTMAGSMVLAAATLLSIVTLGTVQILYVGTILLGLAIALFGTIRLTSLKDTYPDRVGTVHGLLGGIGDVGNTVMPPVAGYIAALIAWQAGFGVLIPLFVLVAFGLWTYVPRRTSPPADSDGVFTREAARRLWGELSRPPLVLGTVIMILGLAAFQAFTGFFPTYLIEEKGLRPLYANTLFAFFFALGIVVRPVAGAAYDRVGVRWIMVVVIGISAVGFTLLPFAEGLPALAAVTVLIGIFSARQTVLMAYMTTIIAPEVQNTGLGILRTFFFISGAISPVIFGAIADRGYFDEGFLILAVLSLVMMLVVLRLPPLTKVATAR